MIDALRTFVDSGGTACAVMGTNGSGKSRLAEELAAGAEVPCALVSLERHIAVIEEERRNDDSDFLDYIDPGRSVLDFIEEGGALTDEVERWIDTLRVEPILNRGLRFLSTGEFRKAQVARAIAEQPRLLVLDEPFDGLDVRSRGQLTDALDQLAAEGYQLVLFLNRVDELIDATERIFLIDEFGLVGEVSRGEELERFFKLHEESIVPPEPPERERLELPAGAPLIDFRQVRVAYGDRVVFKNLDWRVERGEHWRVRGPNGCGKTTLLEMVTGDHPQLYANDVSVFGIRRGSGESVWDIKRHIGHVSSSVQVGYRVGATALEVVVSGFHDSIGLYRRPSPAEVATARAWLDLIHLGAKASRPLRALSYGEQRMLLIARAMVKRPELLVLDEPCQGLDEINRRAVLKLINHIGEAGGTTILFVSHHAEDRVPIIKRTLEMGA